MNTADILDKAATLINKRGHCKFVYRSQDGALCARGAIIRAVAPRYSFDRNRFVPLDANKALEAFDTYLLRTSGWWGHLAWNDAKHRTKEEVVSALRAAAQAARAEQ